MLCLGRYPYAGSRTGHAPSSLLSLEGSSPQSPLCVVVSQNISHPEDQGTGAEGDEDADYHNETHSHWPLVQVVAACVERERGEEVRQLSKKITHSITIEMVQSENTCGVYINTRYQSKTHVNPPKLASMVREAE